MRKIYYLFIGLLMASWAGAQITVYPNVTDFESEPLCGTSCTGACALTGTWRNADQWGFAQAGTDWLSENGSTPSTDTGPDVDHTFGTTTNKYCYVETSGCNNTTAHLVSDIFNFSSLAAPKIRFWYHMYGATMGTMHLDVDTTGTGMWVLNAAPQWTANANVWTQMTADLSAYAGRPSIRLRFRGQTGTSFTSDMALDDIEVFDPAPFDVEVITVSAGGGCGNSVNTPVEVTYYNAGTDTLLTGDTLYLSFMIGSTTVMDTVIIGSNILPGDTVQYTFVNGGADLSGPTSVNITAWSGYGPDINTANDTATATAIGIPIITSYPYFEDFEAGQNGWRITNNTAGTWAFGTPAKTTINSAGSGANSFVTGGLGAGFYNNLDISWVEGPCFDFTNVCDPVISAKVWWNAEFSWDGMNITTSTDGGATWQMVGAYLDPINWYTDNTVVGFPLGYQDAWSGRASTSNGSNGWVTVKHRLTGLGGQGSVKIRFNFGTDGSVTDDGVAFDDVRITNGAWLGDDQLVCSPTTVGLSADVGGASDTYAWSTGATTSGITVSTTGWYSVALTGPTCTTTDSVYVVVVDGNTDVDLGPDTTACGVYNLNAGMWPNSTIVWSTGDSTMEIGANMSGTYSVSVITACGTLTDSVTLTVNPNPVVDLGADTTSCDSYTLDAGNGGTTYAWSNGDTTSTSTVTSSGTYTVTVSDAIGCSETDDVVVTILPSPAVSLGGDQLLCNGASAVLDAGNPGATYLWSTSAATQTITVSTAATYSVAVTDSSGCTGMDTVVVTTANDPTAGFNFTVGGAGLDYDFTSTSTGATSYSWNFGDGSPVSTQQNPSHTYAPGSYTVTLIATNGCGSDTTTQSVTVVGLSNFADGTVKVFPNPNNGKFHVTFDLGVAEEVTLTVTNLTGQEVYVQNLGLVSGSVRHEVQLGALPAGMYMVRLQSVNGQSTHMLRVE
jgi:hypothetical protein